MFQCSRKMLPLPKGEGRVRGNKTFELNRYGLGCRWPELFIRIGSVRVRAPRLRPLKSLCFLCLLVFTFSLGFVGVNLRFGTRDRPGTQAPVCAPARRLSEPAPA